MLFQVVSGAEAVTIDHNTGFQSGQIIIADGIPSTNFVYQNNITPHNMYGVMGSGYAPGISSLDHFFPGFVFEKNLIEDIATQWGVTVEVSGKHSIFTGLGSGTICELCERELRLGTIQSIQKCWDGRQGHWRRHSGAQRGNRLSHRSLTGPRNTIRPLRSKIDSW